MEEASLASATETQQVAVLPSCRIAVLPYILSAVLLYCYLTMQLATVPLRHRSAAQLYYCIAVLLCCCATVVLLWP